MHAIRLEGMPDRCDGSLDEAFVETKGNGKDLNARQDSWPCPFPGHRSRCKVRIVGNCLATVT